MEMGLKECSKCENNLRCKECALPHVNENLEAEIKELKYLFGDKRKHGKWIKFSLSDFDFVNRYKCSVCKNIIEPFPKDINVFQYCHNCGARMDGDNNIKRGDS